MSGKNKKKLHEIKLWNETTGGEDWNMMEKEKETGIILKRKQTEKENMEDEYVE